MEENERRGNLRWLRNLTVAALALIILAAVFYYLLMAGVIVYAFQGWKTFFYEKLGLDDTLSTALANLCAFGSAFALIPLLWLTYYTFNLRKFPMRKFLLAFVGFAFFFILGPVLQWLFGTDVCFNRTTGEPLKWYYVEYGGAVKLSSRPGYDPTTGTMLLPATAKVCEIYARQLSGFRPQQIHDDPRTIEFYRSDNAYPLVWYSRGSGGAVRLFNGPGFDPVTREELQPVPQSVVNQLISQKNRADRGAANSLPGLDGAQRLPPEAMLPGPGPAPSPPQSGAVESPHSAPLPSHQSAREDCVSFSPSAVRTSWVYGRWKVTDGSSWLLDFASNTTAARRAVSVIRSYGFDQQCFVRRPSAPMMYWKSSSHIPSSGMPGDDCVGLNPSTAVVELIQGDWKIVDGTHWVISFGTDREGADQALSLIKAYNLDRQCFIVRPHASMKYWLRR